MDLVDKYIKLFTIQNFILKKCVKPNRIQKLH